MKKTLLLLVMLCSLGSAAVAQVISGYEFGSYAGTYEEISDGTVVNEAVAGEEINNRAYFKDVVAQELTTGEGYPIGFEFEYNDVFCNQFVIGSNGYVTVGRDAVTVDPTSGAFMFARTGEGRTNCFGVMPNADIFGSDTTTISYKLTGEAPERVLVVQYKNWGIALDFWGEEIGAVDMQIKLYEAGSKIEYVFRNWDRLAGRYKNVRVGLRGDENDILCRVSDNDDWTNTYKKLGDGLIYIGDNSNISNGLTYTFTPPAACEVPAAQPGNLQYTASTTGIEGEFEPCEGADHYLVLLSNESVLSELPQAGSFYATGDAIGNATVLSYDTTTVFSTNTVLDAATTYHITVMAANSYCSHGPQYNTDAPLNAAIRTMPAAPSSLSVTNLGTDYMTIDVTANTAGDNVMVAICDSLYAPIPNYAMEPYMGNPQGSYEVGDYIVENGGRVVYIGSSAENIVIDGLESGKGYYLRAYSVNADMEYSTEVAETRAATIATLPYSPNLSNIEAYGLPVGWSETGGTFRVAGQYNQVGGEDEYQLECNLTMGDGINGKTNVLTTSPILVNMKNAAATFYYNMSTWTRMTGSVPYNEWAETDTFALQVSNDGVNYKTLQEYTAANNPQLDSIQAFVKMEGDLSEYVNDTIRLRIYWKTYSSSGARLIIERFGIDGIEIPAVPVVTMGEITYNSAVVTWRGGQENYQVASCKEGEEWSYSLVTGFEAQLIDLEAETTYQVKVRGIVAEGDTTEWSETATFTTEPLPDCPIPGNLTYEKDEEELIHVSWTGNEEHLSWDLRYRPGDVTSWTVVEGLEEERYTFTDLEPETSYLWTVRATCTMDRISSWAAQERFISGSSAISLANADALKVTAFDNSINIINTGVFVRRVTLYDLQGRFVNEVEMNSSDNVMISTRGSRGIVIVKVSTADKEFIYKVKVE